MPTVTVYTAARMKQIEDETVVNGYLTVDEDLVLVRRDGVEIQAGSVLGPTRTLLETMNDEYVDGGLVDGSGNLILSRNGGGTINAGSVVGPQGEQGLPGTNGQGVPTGGTTDQWLKKLSNTNYDMGWANAPDSALKLFANVTLGANGTIVIDNIPQTARDLMLVIDGLTTVSTSPQLRVNDVTTSVYNYQAIYASGGTIGGVASGGTSWELRSYTQSTRWLTRVTLGRYTEAVGHHGEYFSVNNTTSPAPGLGALYCSDANPITKLTTVTTFATGTRVALYGRGTA